MILRSERERPCALTTLVKHAQTGARVDEDLTNGPSFVGCRLVESRLTLLIVLPVHDELLVLALLDQKLDDVLVPEPAM